MEKRIVTAVKQRFSIRKLSIGAASVLLGTSLYFMGVSAPVVHADTIGEPAASSEKTDSSDPSDSVSVAKDSTKSDVDVNNAINQYAEDVKTKLESDPRNNGNKVIIRPSDKQPVTVNTTKDRANQVNNIKQKIDQANQGWDAINTCQKSNNKQIKDGKDSDYFENQSLSVDDEKKSEINQITVDGKGTTLLKGQSKNIDGIDIIHTTHMTDKEREAMKVNSNNKVIVNFQPDQCSNKEITVTYDNLKNSYYLENINNETSRIKISRIDRTFSGIQVAENPKLFYGGWRGNKYDNYDPCNGPQLIIYNDPSDGFFYNNIQQISVKDTYYYDDKGTQKQISFDTKDPAWVFVTSLNSNGGGNIEKVRALGSDDSPVNGEKIAGSTVTDHNDGWYYSDNNNNFSNANNIFGQKLDWDNNDEYNRFGFVGTAAFQYQLGMTLQYRSDDSQWGSHWACMQTQVVSSLNENVIIRDHIKDDTENVTGNDDVNMTVHYVMDDGSKAPSDSKQTVNFTEDGTQDLVTKHIDWTPADSQTFKNVATKTIVGYTPDKENVTGQTVNFGDSDINVTVTYHANAQTAKITYIDDTTKNNLYSQAANGKFGQTITFTTTPSDEIENYKKQGYVLVSNTFDNNKYQADNGSNVFYVHLKHGTKDVSRSDDVNMTVHYAMDDNSEAPSDNKQTLSFTENGIQDLVTKHIDWIPTVSQTFKDVATKSIVGYTPDQDNVAGQIVNFGAKDINVTVTYNANTQNAKITYIDDTTKTNLKSKETSGKFGQAITFTTAPSDEIENYKKQGYVLVSNTFDNNKYQADNSNNVFYVHFVHGTKNVSRTDDVKMTVHYVMDDNSEAPSDNKQTLSFTENGIQDLVTKHIDWTPTVSQTFKDVVTPTVAGYTPDQDNVAGQTVNFDDQDVEVTVRYNANTQNAKITYIDDTTKTNLDSKETSGKFGQAINFTTAPADEIENYKKQGYVLVSNTFDNNKYQDDNSRNVFYVHLKHGTKKVSRSDDVNMTVHYVMDDNSEAPSDNKQTLSFTENGIKDLVTKHIDWTPAVSQTLKDVDSPVLTGYTADIKTANGKVVNFGDNDVNVTVHYSANTQTATITYIDDTEKKTLGSDNQNGKFNQVITFEHDPAEVIKGLEEKGYVFVSNTFDNQKYQADNSDNVFEVHLKHKTESVTRNGAVTRTIHYLYDDGNTAKPDKIQTVSFNETGTKDYVTNKTTWDNDDAQTVDSVITPSITGYTPDKDKVAGQTFKFGDKNVEVTVRYNANAQTAMITYIDDTEKKTLGSDNQNGKFNQVITFEHDPAEVIKGLEEKGYQLVSDNFEPGIKYQADNKSNSFEVHLVHTYEPVETSQTITETVHYIDTNGKPVAPDHVATVVVKVTGTRDKVTNTTTWNTPSTGHFDKVLSPVVPNMIPDKKFIPGRDVQYGDSDITESVVYTLDEMPGEPVKSNKPGDSTPKTPENPNKPGDSTPKTPENPNKPGDSTPKTPVKSNKPGKEVSKQRGMIVETTIPEKHVGSRTADSQVSAKSTAKRELPQTGATISVGVWVGLASMIVSLGLLGAIKKCKKN